MAPRHKLVFWAIMLAFPVVAFILGIGQVSYWSMPRLKGIFREDGGPFYAYDPAVGTVNRPHAQGQWVTLDAKGQAASSFHVFHDRIGARVSAPGEETPAHVDLLFLGDSVPWGYNVENQDTYPVLAAHELGASEANLSVGGSGTVQALLLLRRHLDLGPKVVVYAFVFDHLKRSLLRCGPRFYPMCMDLAYVTFAHDGTPRIVPASENGIDRVYLQVKWETGHLDPLTWLVHGVDVAISRLVYSYDGEGADDAARQAAAFEYLMREMKASTDKAGAKLLVFYVPHADMLDPPPTLAAVIDKLKLPYVNPVADFRAAQAAAKDRPLYLPDGHFGEAGHAAAAAEIAAYVRQNKLLGP